VQETIDGVPYQVADQVKVSPLAERLEKMREGVRNLKAQRDGLRAEIASMERDLEQVNDAVLRNEGALAMIQQLVQEDLSRMEQREGGLSRHVPRHEGTEGRER
jgi:chromosome segregation ATPase